MKSPEQFQQTMGQHLVFATFLSAQFSSSDNSSDIAIPAALKSAANLGWELLLMPDRSKVASPAARFEAVTGELATLVMWSACHPHLRWAVAAGKSVNALEIDGESGAVPLNGIAKSSATQSTGVGRL